MKNKFSLGQFLRRFPNDDACLEEIKKIKYPDGITCPKCKKVTNFYKLTDRTAYSCEFCRTQVYPLAGTIFEKTTTPLRLWLYAMFIMVQTRAGISAKQLQRELGVTYKTAWRMFKQIRLLMAQDGGGMLKGTVEADETFIGGKGKNRAFVWDGNDKPKEVVMGIVERGGQAHLEHIPNTGKWTLLKEIKDHVEPNSRVITDECRGYTALPQYGYQHDFVNHQQTYVLGDIHTQNAENIWSTLKRGIYGVYRAVSKKYLQNYVDEYAWRYNHRCNPGNMFDCLLREVSGVKVGLPA